MGYDYLAGSEHTYRRLSLLGRLVFRERKFGLTFYLILVAV